MAENVPDVYVRLDGLQGESSDVAHPGEDGWVQIKGFSFSFGLKAAGDKGKKLDPKDFKTPADYQKALKKAKDEKKKTENEKDDGPFERPEVTLNKTLDIASRTIWRDKCHAGDSIPKVEVVACRYGGEQGDEKIPFATLIFEKVQVRSVSMSISADDLPAESIHFRYDAVKLKYIWTANDSGSRVRGAAAPRAGWDFEANAAVEWGPNE